MTSQPAARDYFIEGRSTDTFGRVLCSARTHHFVVDGPAYNGCPGEAIGPGELFLSGVASCGVELVQVLARNQGLPLKAVSTAIEGRSGGKSAAHPDVSLFSSVHIHFTLQGVTPEQGAGLIEQFKRR